MKMTGRNESGIVLRAAGRGTKIVLLNGRSIGTIHHNVVGIGAIKWSARRLDGTTLPGSFLYGDEAAAALAGIQRR